jgi:hypothetical protein
MEYVYNLDANVIIQWLVPAIVSWIMATSTKLQAMISGWSNTMKRVFYIGLVLVGVLIVWKAGSFIFDPTPSSNMFLVIIRGVIMGVVATFVYWLGGLRKRAATARV